MNSVTETLALAPLQAPRRLPIPAPVDAAPAASKYPFHRLLGAR
jgi:hypothetical protein